MAETMAVRCGGWRQILSLPKLNWATIMANETDKNLAATVKLALTFIC